MSLNDENCEFSRYISFSELRSSHHFDISTLDQSDCNEFILNENPKKRNATELKRQSKKSKCTSVVFGANEDLLAKFKNEQSNVYLESGFLKI